MPRSPRRGEIYRLKQDEVGKPRPVLVVSRGELNSGKTVTVVPFTTQQLSERALKKSNAIFEAGEGSLGERSAAKCGDVATIPISSLNLATGVLGELDASQMQKIDAALKWSLGLE